MAPGDLHLEIVTPERTILETDVEQVILPSIDGYIGILPRHEPMIIALDIGIVYFGGKNDKRRAAVSGGFAEILHDHVWVMADTAELAVEIDVMRARRELEQARKRLRSVKAEWEARRAHFIVEKCLNRLKAAGALK